MFINNLSQQKRRLLLLCFPALSLSSVQAAEAPQKAFIVNPPQEIGNGNFTNSAEITQVDGPGSFVVGQDNTIKSKKGSSSAVGNQNEVDGKDANAFGDGNTAKGEQAQAFGDNNRVNGNQSSSFGVNNNLGDVNATISINSSNIFGSGNKVTASQVTAIGHENNVTKANTVAVGVKNTVSENDSLAIGANNNASGKASIAIGNNTLASNESAVSIGNGTKAIGANSAAIGRITKASGNNTFAAGHAADAFGENAISIGYGSLGAKDSVTIGKDANTTPSELKFQNGKSESVSSGQAVAIGAKSLAYEHSTTVGYDSTANGVGATALGHSARASGANSIAIGKEALVDWCANLGGTEDCGAIAIGNKAQVNHASKQSTVIGQGSKAINAVGGVAHGYDSQVYSLYGIALGSGSRSGTYNHTDVQFTTAIGGLSNASANLATAIGAHAKATHANSVALGASSQTGDAVDTDNATVGNLTYGGFAGNKSNGATVSVGAGENNTRQIQNVSAGRITKSSTDAINGSQLYATNAVLDNVAQSTKKILGGNSTVNANGTLSMTNIGDTGKDNVHDAIKFVKENDKNTQNTVTAGKNLDLKATDNANGTKNYHLSVADDLDVSSVTSNKYKVGDKTYINKDGINANDQKITNVTNGEISEISKDAINGSQLYQVKNDINKNVNAAKTEVKQGKNIKVTETKGKDGQSIYEVSTTDDLNVNSVTSNEYKVGNKTYINKDGINANNQKITNVTNGEISETSKDAINGSQLYQVKNDINKNVNAAKTEVKQGKNIKITETKGNNGQAIYEVATEDDLNVNSVTSNQYKVGDKTYISKDGINANSQKITNVKDGEISETSKDAINGSQIYQVKNELNKNIKAAKTEVKEGKNIKVTKTKGANGQSVYEVATANDLDVNSVTAGNTVLSKTGLNNGGNKITNVAAGEISNSSTDGVNGAQLHNVADSTAKALGGSTSVQNGRVVTNNLGNTGKNTVHEALLASREEVTAGKNIKVTSSKGANGQTIYNVATADDLSVNSITSSEYKVGNKTYINQDGINANNQKIKNVAQGVDDTDAVNVAQLKAANNNSIKMINKLDSKVHRVDRHLRAGIAGSAAIASTPQVRFNGKSMLAIGAATYRGESATAVKYSRASDNGHWTVSLSGSIDTRGNAIVGSGAGYEW
ncbi:YadA-like family protein [Rodentibacter myodis]|uniref:Adhesin n=1 Tax=Rodentibacter myodis TaxID=1907939 RepID=A0A1V3JQ28_9PAST|nr:YadA-like family protein [Rodentibacter myodis]OOF58777.1 hypothetical protein BKL49_06435 [Rodentibacter myodis]